METNNSLESIKIKLKQKNPSIKEVEFVKAFSPIDFSVKMGIIINGEKMPFHLTSELMQDIKFGGYIYGYQAKIDEEVENEISTLLNNEYDKLEFKSS